MKRAYVRDFAVEVREMTAQGLSPKEIAAALGLQAPRVRAFQLDEGLRKKRTPSLVPFKEQVIAMAADGVSNRRIASRLGVKYQTLRAFMSKNGIRAAIPRQRKLDLRIEPDLYAAIKQRAGHRPVENAAIDLLAAAVKA